MLSVWCHEVGTILFSICIFTCIERRIKPWSVYALNLSEVRVTSSTQKNIWYLLSALGIYKPTKIQIMKLSFLNFLWHHLCNSESKCYVLILLLWGQKPDCQPEKHIHMEDEISVIAETDFLLLGKLHPDSKAAGTMWSSLLTADEWSDLPLSPAPLKARGANTGEGQSTWVPPGLLSWVCVS